MSQITTNHPDAPTTCEARSASTGTQVPVVNIHQDADGYTLAVEMPGVAKSGVDITYEDGKLVLTGRRELATSLGQAVYRETNDANYRRVFDLDPSIDAQGIEAAIDQGVLTLRLPRAEAAKPRKIAIQ